MIHEVTLQGTANLTLGRVLREIAIAAPLKGSLSTVHDGSLWLGGYEKDAPSRIHEFPLAVLRAKSRLTESDATRSIPIPSKAQGAAFDANGNLWITRSGSKLGELVTLDPSTGAARTTYSLPAGVEGLVFTPENRLWTLSEAGSRRWNTWPTHYPLIFELAPDRLR